MNARLTCLFARLHHAEPFARDGVLLLLRLLIGLQFFLTGKGKLANLDRTTEFFAGLHIPAPGFHAGLVGTVEMVGGILLLVGLLTRLAAVPLVISMIVAYLTAHKDAILEAEGGFTGKVGEFIDQTPFPFLVVCLVLLVFGAGRISVDELLARRCHRA